jgi:hypothetical protein
LKGADKLELNEESLHVLSCDIELRPRNAAGIEHLLPYLCKIESVGDAVHVYFDLAGAEAVRSFVDAERLCCTSLSWTLAHTNEQLHLTVGGTPEQTALIRQWFVQEPV